MHLRACAHARGPPTDAASRTVRSPVPPLLCSKPLYLCLSRSQKPSVHARVLLMTLDFQRPNENESRIFQSLGLIPFSCILGSIMGFSLFQTLLCGAEGANYASVLEWQLFLGRARNGQMLLLPRVVRWIFLQAHSCLQYRHTGRPKGRFSHFNALPGN